MAKSTRNPLDRRRFSKRRGRERGSRRCRAGYAGIQRSASRVGAATARKRTLTLCCRTVCRDRKAAADTPADLTVENAGSDFMVDVLKSLGFEYIAANPGSSFRGLHESFINYGGNKNPELITCCHEESSVALAHGYSRVEGQPMAVMAHSTVGLQHASMDIYNAFVARNPVFIVLGNTLDANERRPGVEWNHSVQDAASMVRDFIKWDDTPISLTHFAESAVRAYKIAMTVPMAPVVLVADSDLQENSVGDRSKLRIPKLTLTSPPAGDPGGRRGSGEAAGRGRESGHRRRPRRARRTACS